ncbi:Probable peptidase [Mycobacteroides abscessus]|nr:Probable peptidase [Mycobacteroides abscessus]
MNDTMHRILTLAVAVLALASCGTTQNQGSPATTAPAVNDDRGAFRDLYRELVETNTTASQGSCTEAAQKMATRLKGAGYADKDLVLFSPPDHPKDGGLVATLGGSDAAAKPILLLAHIDVVEANARTGSVTRSRSPRTTGISMRAEPRMTRRWPRSLWTA